MDISNEQSLEHEFDVLMSKAGIVVPIAWRAGALAAYGELKKLSPLLRQPRAAESEPAHTFSIVAVTKRDQ